MVGPDGGRGLQIKLADKTNGNEADSMINAPTCFSALCEAWGSHPKRAITVRRKAFYTVVL
jgi:hypothetical protein